MLVFIVVLDIRAVYLAWQRTRTSKKHESFHYCVKISLDTSSSELLNLEVLLVEHSSSVMILTLTPAFN